MKNIQAFLGFCLCFYELDYSIAYRDIQVFTDLCSSKNKNHTVMHIHNRVSNIKKLIEKINGTFVDLSENWVQSKFDDSWKRINST